MKRLVIIALALATFNGMAQEKMQKKMGREHAKEIQKQMTPSEMAEIQTKKLTLKLDLTDEQQKKVYEVLLKQAELKHKVRDERKVLKSEDRENISKEELLKQRNEMLDQRIEMKREMKSILTPEQYAKYEQMNSRRDTKRRLHDGKPVKQLQKSKDKN